MSFTIPTLLQVRGVDDDNQECIWYAEAVGRIKKHDEHYYEGYYLVPSKTKPSYLVYDETYEHIPEDSVIAKLGVKSEGYALAWGKMGILMNESGHFIKVGEPEFEFSESDDDDDDEDDIGSIDSYSTESDDGISNISDLIDDSEEAIPSSNDEETRTLNVQFRNWVPKDEKENRVKSFIESLEHKAAQQQDERAF